MIKKYNKCILFFSVLGFIFSIYLIILDIINIDYCPKIFFIPACYIVIISFILILISDLFNFLIKKLLFIVGFNIGFIISIWFSYNEIMNSNICPRLFDIPMCYLSLCIFLIIITLKIKDIYN